jgi:hypothetical protein
MVAGKDAGLVGSEGESGREYIMASPHVSRDCESPPLRFLNDARSREISPNRISSTNGTTSGKSRSMTNNAAVTTSSLGKRRVDA